MRNLIFFYLFISISITCYGQVMYETPSGKPIFDIKSYLLEGGRVIEVPYEPSRQSQYDISIGSEGPAGQPSDSLNDQRNLSQQQYQPPILNQAGLEIFRNSIASIFTSGKVQYSENQQRGQAERANVARNVDAINRNLPLMLQHLEELTKQVENQVAKNYLDRSAEITKRNRDILKSDFSPEKKRALLNVNRVKMNTQRFDGQYGKKLNAVRAKYLALEEEDVKNESAYPFLDMGATSFHQSIEYNQLGQANEADDALELSNTFLDIALGATPFVGVFKDAWEAYSGKNLVSGETLSNNERVLSVVGLGAGIMTGGMLGGVAKTALNAERIGKFIKFSDRLLPFASKARESARAIFTSAADLGLKTRDGIISYGRFFKSLSTLPEGTKILRIKEGFDPSKVAAIGRKMRGGVDDLANHFKANNVNMKTFEWSKDAEKQFLRLSNLSVDGRIPYEEVKKTLAYSENKLWAEDLIKKGFTIFDIGDPKLANFHEGLSAFYDLEKEIIFGVIK